LKKGELVTSAHKDYFSKLNALPGHPVPFWVVDGNLTATIADIEALALILKPGLIVIDGAYLAKHPTEKDRYRRIAENMDLIKMDLAALAPTICSWQFNRDLKKLKKGEEGGLDEIGGSAAIGHHSSLVLGLFEDDTVETEKRRRVSIKKGRNGEEGEFFIKWAFTQQTTDFSQVEEETLETLAF
jgi:replicative DNA helicase